MKLLVLFLSFVSVVAWAQIGEDPNMDFYNDTAVMSSTVVDSTGTYAAVAAKDGQKAVSFCPTCNLHGSLNLVDENGSNASGGSSNSGNNTNSEDTTGQGP